MKLKAVSISTSIKQLKTLRINLDIVQFFTMCKYVLNLYIYVLNSSNSECLQEIAAK